MQRAGTVLRATGGDAAWWGSPCGWRTHIADSAHPSAPYRRRAPSSRESRRRRSPAPRRPRRRSRARPVPHARDHPTAAADCRPPAAAAGAACHREHRAAHRQKRRMQDVERVDLRRIRPADAETQRPPTDQRARAGRARPRTSTFESAMPAIGLPGRRITAAATTGPASGPRPASSTPATRHVTRGLRRPAAGAGDTRKEVSAPGISRPWLPRGRRAAQLHEIENGARGARAGIAFQILMNGKEFPLQRISRGLSSSHIKSSAPIDSGSISS